MCIRLHGLDRCNLVMDPFSGLGNTAVACARLGIPFIGYEIDEFYFAESIERVAQVVNESAKDSAGDAQNVRQLGLFEQDVPSNSNL